MDRYVEVIERQMEWLGNWASDWGERAAMQIALQKRAAGDTSVTPRIIRRQVMKQLQYGQAFYVSASMCDVLRAMAASMPAAVMADDTMPSIYGFVWLGKSLPLPPVQGVTEEEQREYGLALRAFSWERIVHTTGPFRPSEERPWSQEIVDALNATAMHIYHDRDLEAGQTGYNGELLWPDGDSWSGWQPKTDQSWGKVDAREAAEMERRYILALFVLLRQRILVTSQHRPDRAARKRLERAGYEHEPLVRVVELRRKEVRDREHETHADVDWACRWVVGGHWHRYHTREGLQPRWISPYLKGPNDKPLKPPRAKVFAVVR